MKKLVTVLGARPQFIKASVLSRLIDEKGEIEEVIVHTGQHFDDNMSRIFFEEMGIKEPAYNLGIQGLGHAAMTGQMLSSLEPVFQKENPDLLIVYGDTNSTLAGALAAKKMGISVAHIEAGLRSFNMSMPEEINRIITDRIADLLFCPTDKAVEQLKSEGFDLFPCRVVNSGDIMKDAVEFYSRGSGKASSLVRDLGLMHKDFALATIHRQENTEDLDTLSRILEGLNRLAEKCPVIFPIHPRTKNIMLEHGMKCRATMIDPVGYFDMQELLKHCSLVVTDSGGLQKEAFFHGKPCLIAREETEWTELVDHGYARIVGSRPGAVMEAFRYFEQNPPDYNLNLYGAHVGEGIYTEIKAFLSQRA